MKTQHEGFAKDGLQSLQRVGKPLGIEVVADSPGVGGNLCDHPEGLIVWEAARPLPPQGASDWDMTIMYRTDPASEVPDVLAHVPLMTFAIHSERLVCVASSFVRKSSNPRRWRVRTVSRDTLWSEAISSIVLPRYQRKSSVVR